MEANGKGVLVRDGQRFRALEKGFLEALVRTAEEALKSIEKRRWALADPPSSVEITLVDDEEIARVHGEFLADPAPTDVITFPYGEEGEILVSVETAERQAVEHGEGFEREVALYVVHGILHLCGHEDESEEGRERMNRLQEELLSDCFSPH